MSEFEHWLISDRIEGTQWRIYLKNRGSGRSLLVSSIHVGLMQSEADARRFRGYVVDSVKRLLRELRDEEREEDTGETIQ